MWNTKNWPGAWPDGNSPPAEVDATTHAGKLPPPTAGNDRGYNVGITKSGKTIMTIYDGRSSMSLILDLAATQQLIRLLEATFKEIK